MGLFYIVSGYLGSLITLITAIVAFTWKPRKGKWLLCTSLLLLLLCSLSWHFLSFLEFDQSLIFIRSFQIFNALLHRTAQILLLCFIVVSCKLVPSTESKNIETAAGQDAGPIEERLHVGPVGIGGWLILPAIGLVLSSILQIAGIVICISSFEKLAAQGYGEYFGLNILMQICLFMFFVVTAVFFFSKKKAAPYLMIALMAGSIVCSLILLLAAIGMDEEQFIVLQIQDFVRGIIGGLIWIPYFLISKRVKATFVK